MIKWIVGFLLLTNVAWAQSIPFPGPGMPAATSMITPLLSAAGPGSLSTTAANYGLPQNSINGSWNATLNARAQTIPIAGTFSNLYVATPTATGASATYDVTLMVNGVASTLTCQVTNAALTCNDITNSVSISAADTVEWKICPSNAAGCPAGSAPAAQGSIQIAAKFTSSIAGESFVFSSATSAASAAAPNYISFGGPVIPNATEANVSSIVSTGGVIDKLYVILTAAPGAAKSYTITLYKNGSATALTCQVSGAASTTCNDTTHTVSVAAGDFISIELSPSGTPTAAGARIGARWVPTTPGEAIIFSNAITTPPTTNATRNGNLSGGSASSSTESLTYNVGPSTFTIKNLYVAQDVAPGGGQTRTVTVRKGTGGGQSNTSVTCTIATAATSCNDTSNSVSTSAADLLNWQTTVSGANAALVYFKVGATLYTP